jgi:hypothetical protein
MPPLTRTALLCGLGLFLLTLLVFTPGAGGRQPAPPLSDGVRLVPPGDVRTESVVLLDTSAVYFPGRPTMGGGGRAEVGQPEDAPFPKAASILQFDPSKPLGKDSTLQVPRHDIPSAAKALPITEASPFSSFGSQGLKGEGIAPRYAFFKIYPVYGGNLPVLSGNITHSMLKNDANGFNNLINAPFNDYFEVILSVDSMGKAPLGGVVRLSGSKALDDAIQGWARGIDWSKQLSPGVYRLIVGP